MNTYDLAENITRLRAAGIDHRHGAVVRITDDGALISKCEECGVAIHEAMGIMLPNGDGTYAFFLWNKVTRGVRRVRADICDIQDAAQKLANWRKQHDITCRNIQGSKAA